MTERKSVCSPPSKLPRLSGARVDDGEVTMAAPSPLVLGLGLGVGGSRSDSTGSDKEASASSARDTRPTSTALTFMQRQELECQVLIYRYFAASAPVPVHLVLPIWKSVASSSSGLQRFPSLTGLGRLCFDHRSSGEPQPGRCRRTDGKKWRCSRDVVPGLKYCERHVHRGRGRSRKLMEAAATNAIPIRAVHAAAGAQATNARALALPPPPQRLGFSSSTGAGVLLAHGTARATR